MTTKKSTDINSYFASVSQDPVKFARVCWPQVEFYDKQIEVMYSVRDNDETFVPAGNMLGV